MSKVAALFQPARWDGLAWPDATVVVIASGASLTAEQCDAVRLWRFASGAPLRRVIAVNTSYQRALWADVLYACDEPWWSLYDSKVKSGEWTWFPCDCWTLDERAVRAYPHRRLHHIRSMPSPGLGRQPGVIHQGANGGYQAVNLATQAGARRVVLLGFDMKGEHWHGSHPQPLTNPRPYLFELWIKNFARMAQDLGPAGIEVVNCTPGSALTCFPQLPLNEVLDHEGRLPDPA